MKRSVAVKRTMNPADAAQAAISAVRRSCSLSASASENCRTAVGIAQTPTYATRVQNTASASRVDISIMETAASQTEAQTVVTKNAEVVCERSRAMLIRPTTKMTAETVIIGKAA